MTQLGFYFDNSRCSGCKTCELACKDYQGLGPELTYRRVYDYEGGGWQRDEQGDWQQDVFFYHLSLACNHCSSPICVHVCPTGAMHKEDNGLVRVDSGVCVGCGYCELACPYKAPHVSAITHQSAKCDGCYNRVLAGKAPICVDACPLRALDFGDMTELQRRYGQDVAAPAVAVGATATATATAGATGGATTTVAPTPPTPAAALGNSLAPMPSPGYTAPNIIIRLSPAARPTGDTQGTIANPEEVR
jgi:anaerobic dimethyl sulfoxide reductase subunit B (iron-sulfur subunit)